MMTANRQTPEAAQASEALASHYHTMIDGWAEVSRCCLAAADDIAKTGFDYVKGQVDQLHEIACNPTAAMREETVSRTLSCGFDAADRITQAYLHSLEGVREPLMRVVSAQWPVSRGFAEVVEHGMRRGMETVEQGGDAMRRGAEEGRQGKRRSA